MTGQLDIRDNLRDDERRRRDEARLRALEIQVDELRHTFLEQSSKQTRGEERYKNYDVALAQLASQLDTQRADFNQANDARQLDTARLRQAIEELSVKLEAGTQPIPGLQAQVLDVANQLRTKLQEVLQDRHRFDDLQDQLNQLPPLIDRGTEIAYAVRAEIAATRDDVEAVRGEMRRATDATKIVEQEVRRRFGEAKEAIDAVNVRVDALRDELPPLDVQIDRVRHELQQALPRFDELAAVDAELREEVERLAAVDFERHGQTLARADEVRETLDARIQAVERLSDTRFASTMARFTDLEEADRSIAHRLTLLAIRLEELRDADATVRAEMRRLEEFRLQVHLDQAQQAVTLVKDYLARLAEETARNDGSE